MIGLSLLRTPHPEAFQRDMRRSLGFASATADYAPSSGSLSLRIRRSCGLASPATATRRFIMQKARRHFTRKLRPLVGAWFQVLFHSPHRGAFHRSLTVLYAIGLTGVFSLAGWSRRIRAGFHVSRVTQDTARSRTFQNIPFTIQVPRRGPTTPALRCHSTGLGSSPVARHYWGNH